MRHPVAIFAIALALSGVCPATAAVIYESATLQNYGLAIVTEFSGQQFLGTRFQVTGPVHVTAIGGVMYGGGNTFFGAIVPLSGPSGLPSGSPFSAPITASTTFDPGNPVGDFLTPLSVDLNAGWYGLIFGAGHFGTPSGAVGGMLLNNHDVPGASYFLWNSTLNNGQWSDGGFSGARFVIEGSSRTIGGDPSGAHLPEPSTFVLLGGGLLGVLFLRRLRQRS
ncbi:MAG: PEP-CTERM sorting domain-containing protein [Bryobacterales bacterium]|nr:PEP-CTERM sorting domain-containing protein [Bryobacterales bacterium]